MQESRSKGTSFPALMEGAAELVLLGLWARAEAFWETTCAGAGNVVLVRCAESQQDLAEELAAEL